MDTAQEFLATGKRYHLGFLDTETPHPKTLELSDWAVKDLPRAIKTLVDIDCAALEKLKTKTDDILRLRIDIRDTLASGGRVFLCGCGATGRLSLTLEVLFREMNSGSDKVVAFMAGGDVALVHSLEGFEDFPEYGERHLRELGFSENDLLISPTEGGETPYVIGATEAAVKISRRKPYFLYCNPDKVLIENVERSRRVIENPLIEKINLHVGPMALTGSTRMQASTVLQLAIGYALLTTLSEKEILQNISQLQTYMLENAELFLLPFIERESFEYQSGRYTLYCVRDYPITVFTDTTERAPTFSLTSFSHRLATRLLKLKPSLCYICLPDKKTSAKAWAALLGRAPRPLNWLDVDDRTSEAYLKEFDFSSGCRQFRAELTGGVEHSDFEIFRHRDTLLWRFQDIEQAIIWPDHSSSLFEHTLLKMLLNIHSTLVMGRLGRYKRNLMTWVHPTNGKLIDRATRFVGTLLREDGFQVPYEKIVEKLFEMKKMVSPNESIVLATYDSLRQSVKK
jgi:N-acetylmuramic acid 6-phosphate etherase